MALSYPFALWLLVDFTVLEALARIWDMGGEDAGGLISQLPPCWQCSGETIPFPELSSLQLPIPLFLDPGYFIFFFFFFWCVLL